MNPQKNESKFNSFNHPLLKDVNKSAKNIFLLVRHRGCTFCRESLSELAKYKLKIRDKGISIHVVHMGDSVSSDLMKKEFGLEDVHFISDPNRELYQFFGARRGSLQEVLGPKVLRKGILGGSLLKHGIGKLEGDGFQLGGLYYSHQDTLQCWHRPENAGDVEDWPQILADHL